MLTEEALRHAFRTWPVDDRNDAVKQRIDARLDDLAKQLEVDVRKEKNMRMFTKKKMILAVAAIGLLGSLTVYAAGQLGGKSSHSWQNREIREYGRAAEAVAETGLNVEVKESFANGYAFHSINVSQTCEIDTEGNEIPGSEAKELQVAYGRQGSPEMALFAARAKEQEQPADYQEAVELDGVKGYYGEVTNKFVPGNYELTQEDLANQSKPGYNIAYGSERVEISVSKHLWWNADGVRYELISFDNNMSREEFVQMAVELMAE